MMALGLVLVTVLPFRASFMQKGQILELRAATILRAELLFNVEIYVTRD